VVPAEFIGLCVSPTPIELPGEVVSNHDELMSNFFAQQDALAMGKTIAELEAEGVPENLQPHKAFPGNRQSLAILMPALTPYTAGQLLALYEHRVFVEGAIWGINSFDQWGVELGKALGKRVREQLNKCRAEGAAVDESFLPATRALMQRYLAASSSSSSSST